jgi:two-component system alkaline phosphatase synthesis response regulator PhoP
MRYKILIVDDEPDVVELVEYNLKNAGFEVIKSSDGNESLKKIKMKSQI